MIGRLAGALAALLMLAQAGAAQTVTDAATPGGVRMAHVRLPNEIDQTIAFFWRDRSAQIDPARAGLLELAPNLIVAGGGARLDGAAMDETLKDYGASLALRRSLTATLGEVSAAARHFAPAAEALAGALAAPRLPARILARDKAAILARLKDARQRPDRLAGLLLTRSLASDARERALLLMEPPETITRVEVADIEAWRRAALARDNLVVAAAGPLTRAEAAAIVDDAFAHLPQHAQTPAAGALVAGAPARTILVVRQVAQTALTMGAALRWPAGEGEAARPIIASALGGGPSSRLWIAVRERLGAAYGASAWAQPLSDDLNRFTMQSSVAHEAAPAALAAMQAEYARLLRDGLTEAEIAPIRARLIAGQAETMTRAGPAARAMRAALLAGRSADAPLRAGEEIAALTAAAVNALMRRRLPERLTTIIVAPSAQGWAADCVVGIAQDVDVCD